MALENKGNTKKSVICMQSELFSHEGELVWSIKNFSQFKTSSIASNDFSIVPCCKITWEVGVLLENNVGNTFIVVRRKDEVAKPVFASIRCTFENSKGDAYPWYFLETNFVPKGMEIRIPNSTEGPSSLRWNFDKCSHDDLLIMRCHIKLRKCCAVTETVRKGEYKTSLPRSQLSADFIRGFEKLYTEKLLADVELKVGETSMAAHKAILCMRSQVFQNMFESDMSENRSGIIEIEDVQPKIMEAFLSYLYTETVEDLSIEEIRELYAVGDKYEVGSLQDRCSSVLLENLNEKTVCKTLRLADLHNDDMLKEAASAYISHNFASLKETVEFKALVENDPRLVLHIVMANHALQTQLPTRPPYQEPAFQNPYLGIMYSNPGEQFPGTHYSNPTQDTGAQNQYNYFQNPQPGPRYLNQPSYHWPH